jgi:SulP family sulfate permease
MIQSPDASLNKTDFVTNIREKIYRYVPAIESLRHYSLSSLGLDTMAGLTVAAVAVPQAMAYAQIAGIPAQYGLYTAIVMTSIGALFDSSKQLINGPTNAISIAVLSAVVGLSEAERIPAVVLLALMVGIVQTGITFLRLGDLTRYISHAVIVGFTLGAAILLVLDQLKNLLGLPAMGTGDDHFLKRFWLTISHVDQTNGRALLIGLGTILAAILLRTINQRFRLRLPEFLLAVIFLATVVWYGEFEKQGVRVVGAIPAKLPSFQLPEIVWSRVHAMAGSSLAIALLGLLEAIAMAKAIANKTRQKLDINQQCLSEGVANLVGSLFQCFPGSGSLTRSMINHQAGACTQWSGIISAIAVAGTMILFAPYAYFIPRAGLAGILMLSAWRLVDWPELFYHLKTTRFEAWIVLVTAISAVAISIEFCVLIGVFLSFVLYVPQAARVHLTELTLAQDRIVRERIATDTVCNRIRVYSLEGELFFGAAPELEEHLDKIAEEARVGVRVVVLRLKRARNADAVCLRVFDRFISRMQVENVDILLCGVRPDLMSVIDSSGLMKQLGRDRVFVFEETSGVWSSTLEAVRFAYEIVGQDVCESCPRRGSLIRGSLTDDRQDWYFMI